MIIVAETTEKGTIVHRDSMRSLVLIPWCHRLILRLNGSRYLATLGADDALEFYVERDGQPGDPDDRGEPALTLKVVLNRAKHGAAI